MDPEYLYIRHFRKCRRGLGKYWTCMAETKRIVYYEVGNWSLEFQDNVRSVRKMDP